MPSDEELLGRPYFPPELYIFEEVEIGGGYHDLHVWLGKKEERGWSEPYKKSGVAEYRNRVVRVQYPSLEDLVFVREKLLGMRERWIMYAITREAFICFMYRYLPGDIIRVLSQRMLGVPGTALVDHESCRADLDEAFAHRAVDEALKLLDAHSGL